MLKKSNLSSAITFAIATSLGVITFGGLTGCSDGDTAHTGGNFSRVVNPVGTVVGNVQDTNGNPLVDVTVRVAGKSTKTDAGGTYRIDGVGVTNASGADGETQENRLTVSIEAPTGYLGATITVSPEAVIDGSNSDEVRQNTVTLFVDGFIASSGTAVLPALTSTITGILRNDSTGEPIADTLVTLDMEGVTVGGSFGVQQAQNSDAIQPSYQTFAYTGQSGADGSFTIANVPADSSLIFAVEGHQTVDIDYNQDGTAGHVWTNDEDVTTNVGNLRVTPMVALDDAPPYVISVEGVLDQTATVGVFNDDIDGTAATGSIVINFSEPMSSSVDTNSVIIRDTTNDAYIALASSPALSTDGRTLTIEAAAAIPQGAVIEISLLRADFSDTAINAIDAVIATDDVGFDTLASSANTTNDFLRLTLQMFQDVNTNASAVVTYGQQTKDDNGDDDDPIIQATSAAYNDVDDTVVGFQQMNSADDDDAAGGADAAERLSDLVIAQGGTGVFADVARVTFTPTNASQYNIVVTRDGTDLLGTLGTTITLDPASNTDDVTATLVGAIYEITDLDSSVTPLEFVVTGVEPGDVFEITPLDDLNYAGTSTPITLVDNVEPKPVLQNSYEMGDTVFGIASFDFGDGGELTGINNGQVGIPNLNITPQLLDVLRDDGTDITAALAQGVAWGTADNDLSAELFDNNEVNTSTGLPIDKAEGMYDATAWSLGSWQRTIGVSMSENIVHIARPASPATVLVWTAHNDVTTQDSGTTVNVDLMDATVSDVFTFANTDHNSIIDFNGSVTDVVPLGQTANTASANASVRINDLMPPMVESAIYNGTDFTITFNEDITIDRLTDAVLLVDSAFATPMTLSLINADLDGSASATTGRVLTIYPAVPATGNWIEGSTSGFGNLDRGAMFNFLQYSESGVITYVTQSNTDAENHARLITNGIEDVNGNSWAGYQAAVAAYNATLPAVLITPLATPDFAAIDATGNFQASVPTVAPGTPISTISRDWVFTHPVDASASFVNCGTGVGGAAPNNVTLAGGVYTFNGTAVTDCFATSAGNATAATFTVSSRTLTVDFNLVVPTIVGDTFSVTFGDTAVGLYDSNDTQLDALMTETVN